MPSPGFLRMSAANDRQAMVKRRAPLDLNAEPVDEPGNIRSRAQRPRLI